MFYFLGSIAYLYVRVVYIHITKAFVTRLVDCARHDELTKVYNRVGLKRIYTNFINDRRSNGSALLLLDIDNFKSINDTFGHNVGDSVLVEFANLVNASCRDSDVVVRWGGEEFVVLLHDVTSSGAAAIAEKIRESIGLHVFGTVGSVTVSIGCLITPTPDLESSIGLADGAMYAAKRGGRNRVVVA